MNESIDEQHTIALLASPAWSPRSSVARSLRIPFSRWLQVSINRSDRFLDVYYEAFIARIIIVVDAEASTSQLAAVGLLADRWRRSAGFQERQIFGIQKQIQFLLLGFFGEREILSLAAWSLLLWFAKSSLFRWSPLLAFLLTIFRFDFFVVQEQRNDFLRLQDVRLEVASTDYHSLNLALLASSLQNSLLYCAFADESIHCDLLSLTQAMSAIHRLLVHGWIPIGVVEDHLKFID